MVFLLSFFFFFFFFFSCFVIFPFVVHFSFSFPSLRSKRFSASSSKKLGREQKNNNNKGGGGGEKETVARKPTILKNCVRLRTQLLIGAVLVVLIT